MRRERGRCGPARAARRGRGGGGARDGRAVTAAGTAPSAGAPAAAAVARAPPPLLSDRCCRGRLCHEPRRPETARERRGRGARGPPKPTRPPTIPSGAGPPTKAAQETRGGSSTQQRRSPGLQCPSKVRRTSPGRPLLDSSSHSLSTHLRGPRPPRSPNSYIPCISSLSSIHSVFPWKRQTFTANNSFTNLPHKYIYSWVPSQPLLNHQYNFHIPSPTPHTHRCPLQKYTADPHQRPQTEDSVRKNTWAETPTNAHMINTLH